MALFASRIPARAAIIAVAVAAGGVAAKPARHPREGQ